MKNTQFFGRLIEMSAELFGEGAKACVISGKDSYEVFLMDAAGNGVKNKYSSAMLESGDEDAFDFIKRDFQRMKSLRPQFKK